MLRILNCGAGVQSSTILLMSVHGELPPLDHAIFADTGDEPSDVYEWAQELESIAAKNGICWHRVSRGESISQHLLERVPSGKRIDTIPAFASVPGGAPSPINRSCTRDWKIKPIEHRIKKILGLKKSGHWPKKLTVENWLGISGDEWQRMKCSTNQWQRFWHPLIEEEYIGASAPIRDRVFSRFDCLEWMKANGYPEPPRSACMFCPFHGNAEWRRLRNMPAEWERIKTIDACLRSGPKGLLRGMRSQVYLHRSLRPIEEAPIDGISGQSSFLEECAGVCGV